MQLRVVGACKYSINGIFVIALIVMDKKGHQHNMIVARRHDVPFMDAEHGHGV